MPGSFSEAESQCLSLGVHISEDFFSKSGKFLDLLSDCSRRMNLFGPGEKRRLWKRHVLESVAFAPFLNRGPVVDVGSGAGFPGMILAFLGFDMILVEPRHKRAAFLETAARECAVQCSVLWGRIEDSGPFPPGTQFTARAVKEPAQMIRLISSVSGPGFTLVTRISDKTVYDGASTGITELPIPPLDREGIILQYSHS